ncbi:Histidine kinase [Seminavis robusta]|uniref:Histidine kinase n=1 Tax=Seminavis robusta TaxID=568900 RepID=A0A9N8DZ77_9STRA|nr:Histidine kinase [Seminavis robusta]|eukprot:Sro488_g153060.1 Histidine kinase (582) ;mRNA; f:23438-25183
MNNTDDAADRKAVVARILECPARDEGSGQRLVSTSRMAKRCPPAEQATSQRHGGGSSRSRLSESTVARKGMIDNILTHPGVFDTTSSIHGSITSHTSHTTFTTESSDAPSTPGAFRQRGIINTATFNEPQMELPDQPIEPEASNKGHDNHHLPNLGDVDTIVTAAKVYDDEEENLEARLQEEIPRMEEEIRARIIHEAVEANVVPNDGFRRTIRWVALVVLVGIVASASFLHVGIRAEQDRQHDEFQKHAGEFARKVGKEWRDYEMGAMWVHDRCRDWRTTNFTAGDFEILYNYLLDTGLKFAYVEWVPNVTHEERPTLEAEAYEYYKHHHDPLLVNYTSFYGLEPDPDNPESLIIAHPRSERPFYFPVAFKEPMSSGINLDLFSIPDERKVILRALETMEMQLTPPLYLVGDGPTEGYSVILYSPGARMPGKFQIKPRDLSNLIVRIPELLEQVARFQRTSLSIYLYDSPVHQEEEEAAPPKFMGGLHVKVPTSGGEDSELTLAAEDLQEHFSDSSNGLHYYEEQLLIGNRKWTVVVAPNDDTFNARIGMVIFSGSLILAASLLLAAWMLHSFRQSLHMK